MLRFSFAITERRCDRTARLGHVKLALGVPFRLQAAFMLVTPNQKIQEVGEEALRQIAGGSASLSSILMQQHQIEPVLPSALFGPQKIHGASHKQPMKTLVPNSAHAIQRELSLSFAQKYRFQGESLEIVKLSKKTHKTGGAQHFDSTKTYRKLAELDYQ